MGNKVSDIVAEKILAELEKGVVPWHRPWALNGASCSHKDGRKYSLLNQFLLGEEGEYVTFNQVKAEGGSVKKGAKSKFVVFWTFVKKEEPDEETKEMKIKQFPILRYYNVFNVKDCEGIEAKYWKKAEETDHEVVGFAEEVIGSYADRNPGLKISRDGDSNEAYYCEGTDSVVVPKKEQFADISEYYSTCFHEMVHSTGHKDRLDRFKGKGSHFFGSEDYSFEELIAECGAAMLTVHCGIDSEKTFDNSAAYIDSWKKVIKDNDSKSLVSAFGKAEKAYGFILGEEVAA